MEIRWKFNSRFFRRGDGTICESSRASLIEKVFGAVCNLLDREWQGKAEEQRRNSGGRRTKRLTGNVATTWFVLALFSGR